MKIDFSNMNVKIPSLSIEDYKQIDVNTCKENNSPLFSGNGDVAFASIGDTAELDNGEISIDLTMQELEASTEALKVGLKIYYEADTLSREEVCYLLGSIGYSHKDVQLTLEAYYGDEPMFRDYKQEAYAAIGNKISKIFNKDNFSSLGEMVGSKLKNLGLDIIEKSMALVKASIVKIKKLGNNFINKMLEKTDALIVLKDKLEQTEGNELVVTEKAVKYGIDKFVVFAMANNNNVDLKEIMECVSDDDGIKKLLDTIKKLDPSDDISNIKSELSNSGADRGPMQAGLLDLISKYIPKNIDPIYVSKVNGNKVEYLSINEEDKKDLVDVKSVKIETKNNIVGLGKYTKINNIKSEIDNLLKYSGKLKVYVKAVEYYNSKVGNLKHNISNNVKRIDDKELYYKNLAMLDSLNIIGSKILLSCMDNFYINFRRCIVLLEIIVNSNTKK